MACRLLRNSPSVASRTGTPPAVSVLLPARNAEATLTPALRSVQRQTYADFECVLIDDGSSDATAAIAREFAASDPRFRLLQRPAAGLVASLNAGAAECRGRFIARMDADDLMHRERLAAQVRALEEDTALALVGTHVRLFPRTQLGTGMREYEIWLNQQQNTADLRADLFIESPLAHPTWMMRREVLARFPYRELPWTEDYDLLLRLVEAGEKIGVVPRRLLCWREHPGRLTHAAGNLRIEAFMEARAHFLARKFLLDHETYVLWGYGDTGRALRRALLPLGKTPSEIIEVHPGRIGQTIHGAKVIAPEELTAPAGRRLLASVARAGPRALVREALATAGWREGADFRCTA